MHYSVSAEHRIFWFQISPYRLIAIVGSRALTTSQSAKAHFILLRRIFEIASDDTNLSPRFLHIHGTGFEAWIADAHKGQALGESKPAYLVSQNPNFV